MLTSSKTTKTWHDGLTFDSEFQQLRNPEPRSHKSKTIGTKRGRMVSTTNCPVVVVDNGSSTSKLGYAGMVEPEVVVASAIGTKRKKSHNKIFDEMSYVVESHKMLLEHNSTHDFNFMIRNGLVQDWDALERLWHSCIYEKLRCNPEDHCFLISESPFNSPENREQMAEIMFETFNIPGLYIGVQPILSLVASWGSVDSRLQQLSGTVVDSGDGTTTIIPVADGHILRNGIQQIPLGGRDLTSYVQDQLRQNNRNVPPSQSYEVARLIKEQHGYVCSNVAKEQVKSVEQKVGGKYSSKETWECTVGEERFLAGEVLFQPSLLNGSKSRVMPLPNLVDTTIQMCPIDIRRVLYNNIVPSGGTTMFPDFGRRLQRDLNRIVNT
jgi:actin-related protein 3